MLMKNNFWNTLCRNAETGDGSGASGGGETGTVAGDGAAAVVAGSESAAPATTFLNEAGKPAEAAPAEGEAAATEGGGEAKPAEAPAAFDIAAVTLPEGVTLDEEVGKSFSDILGNAELSPQDRGQQLLDLHTKALADVTKSVQDGLAEQAKATWSKMNEDWRGAIKDLPEFKSNPDAEAGKVMQALKGLGAGEDFFTALDLTGAGNHPAILQVLHRLAQPLFEGSAVSGQGKPASAKRLGDNMYTSTTKPS